MFRLESMIYVGCVFFWLFSISCYAEEKHSPGVPYYYASFADYYMPPKPIEKLTLDQAKKRDFSYYVAYYDDQNRIVSFAKYLKGKELFTEKYFYTASGKLDYRQSTDENGITKLFYYDEKGKLIKELEKK